MIKNKITTALIIRHFDLAKEVVIIVSTSKWAILASPVQDYEGLFMPVMFTSRTLNANKLNYSTVENKSVSHVDNTGNMLYHTDHPGPYCICWPENGY